MPIMADNIFSHALAAAAESQGGTQALAQSLRVPERTLLRWMAGRAMMPVLAFSRLLDILADQEKPLLEAAASAAGPTLTFRLNDLDARCASCQGSEFVPCAPAPKLRYGAVLACLSCGTHIVHRTLLLDLAILHARQSGNHRARRAVIAHPQTRSDTRVDVENSE
jgi:hypothetical protein